MNQSHEKQLVKASAAIHISHDLSLLQLQIWNILLDRARPYMGTCKEFEISIAEILSRLDLNTNNTSHIKKSLLGLCARVEFDLLNKDKHEQWGFFHMLDFVAIKNGVCRYRYSPRLQACLNNPRMFAKLNLLIQRRFTCKHSLFLYELALDYKNIQQTPWIKLDTFKTYMGLAKGAYLTFALLNRYVIKKAAREVNQVSDLLIEVELKKENRKVVAIKFLIAEKKENQDLVERLIECGVSKKQVAKIIDDTSREDIEYTLKLAMRKKDTIKNLPGWLAAAFAGGWKDKDFDREIEHAKKRELLYKKQLEDEMIKRRTEMRAAESCSKRDVSALATYNSLPEGERRRIDAKFSEWVKLVNDKMPGAALSLAKCKAAFLAKELFDKGKDHEKI